MESRRKASDFITGEVIETVSGYKKGKLVVFEKPRSEGSKYYFPREKGNLIKKEFVRLIGIVKIKTGASWYTNIVGQTRLVYKKPISGFLQVKDTEDMILVEHCDLVFHTIEW